MKTKAEAARENGRKGGRPRKHMRADPPETPKRPAGKWALTRREEALVHQIVTFPEKTHAQCYIDAGYRAKDTEVARVNCGKVLRKDHVARALAAARQALSERHKVTQERVLQELGRIGFFDIRKMFEARGGREGSDHVDVLKFYKAHQPQGPAWDKLPREAQQAWIVAAQLAAQPISGGYVLKSPDQLDDDTAAAIAGVEVVTKSVGDGEVEYIHKVRTVDKTGALTLMAKHLGMLKDDSKHQPNPVPLFALPADARPDLSGAGT